MQKLGIMADFCRIEFSVCFGGLLCRAREIFEAMRLLRVLASIWQF